MTITPEQLAAYADGELDDVTAARMRREIEADPVMAQQLAQLTALRGMLADRFDPILAEPVPVQLSQPLVEAAKVVDLSAVRAARQTLWQRPVFRLAAGSAIAASLVAVLMIGQRPAAPSGYADTQLAAALDGTLSGQTASDGTELLLSFRTADGSACRGYSGKAASGIACRDAQGWKIRQTGASGTKSTSEYQQAGSASAAIMAAAQDLAAGPALDAAAEEAARKSGWIAQK